MTHRRRHVIALPHEPQVELTQVTCEMQQTENLDFA